MKIAVISAILEQPTETQKQFNEIVSDHKHLVKGRMGIPNEEKDIAVISLTIVAEEEQIKEFARQLKEVPHALVETIISRKEV